MNTSLPCSRRDYRRLPRRIRFLCAVVCILLVCSALAELWIMLEGWFYGEAFQKIYQGYCRYYPELKDAVITEPFIFNITMLLDYLTFIPYIIALLLAAIIFHRLRREIFWDAVNIGLLKYISFLLVFDAIFPAVKNTLQVLAFTYQDHPLLTFSYGISIQGSQLFIIGIAVYTFSLILRKARALEDENSLII